MPAGLRIAIVGAESTGKSELATALGKALRSLETTALQGFSVAVVPEVLRQWCNDKGRVPDRHEQGEVAREQERLVVTAAATHDLVIADTTSLMTAVYSEHVYADDSLCEFARAMQSGYVLHLVTGLDIEWVADGIQRDGPHVREHVDARVRHHLRQWQRPHATVWGRGPARLQSALLSLAPLLRQTLNRDISALLVDQPRLQGAGWQWTCERCSDGSCEHQLFRSLVPGP